MHSIHVMPVLLLCSSIWLRQRPKWCDTAGMRRMETASSAVLKRRWCSWPRRMRMASINRSAANGADSSILPSHASATLSVSEPSGGFHICVCETAEVMRSTYELFIGSTHFCVNFIILGGFCIQLRYVIIKRCFDSGVL